MKTLLSLAIAAFAFTASPAVAQTAGSSQLAVSYADLDLRTGEGVRMLDRRIRSAVEQACGPISSADPAGTNQVLDCRSETLASARAQRDLIIAAANANARVQLASRR
jgi:UrcA family protein